MNCKRIKRCLTRNDYQSRLSANTLCVAHTYIEQGTMFTMHTTNDKYNSRRDGESFFQRVTEWQTIHQRRCEQKIHSHCLRCSQTSWCYHHRHANDRSIPHCIVQTSVNVFTNFYHSVEFVWWIMWYGWQSVSPENWNTKRNFLIGFDAHQHIKQQKCDHF